MRLVIVPDIRLELANQLIFKNFVGDKTGAKTVELLGAQFLSDEPTIFGSVNNEYIQKELDWYRTGSLNIHDMTPPVPQIWKDVAGYGGAINSNYGYLITSVQNGNQFLNVSMELQRNKESRRAIMIYTRPTMHHDFEELGKNDFICTNTVQYFIRNNHLFAYVSMRSNDAVFGYKNDWAWQMYVLCELWKQLIIKYTDLKIGNIIWNVGSLHVYQRHFYMLIYFLETGVWNISKSDFDTYRKEHGLDFELEKIYVESQT